MKGGATQVFIPEQDLKKLYLDKKLSVSTIAQEYNCSLTTISLKLRKYNIRLRSLSEANRLVNKGKTKLHIPKEELKNLFIHRSLGIDEISSYYNCSIYAIRKRLFEYRIVDRLSNGRKIEINKKELSNLYLKKRLTTCQIANRYGCCPATISKKLIKFSIKRRQNHELYSKIPSKKLLKELYTKKRLSTWKIEKRYGYVRSTVHNKLKEYGIKIRTLAEANTKYKKYDFSGNLIEKAYLIGFRLGDLRVRKIWENSEIIHVDCGSTIKEQIGLIRNLFKDYGRVWISKPNNKGCIQIECYLNSTFNFLLPKETPYALVNDKKNFFSFLAGFTDAEGHIGTGKKGAIYTLGNYNKEILIFIKKKLDEIGITINGPYQSNNKGTYNNQGYIYNENYNQLALTRKSDLLRLLGNLKPYIKHRQKIKDLNSAIDNILERNRKYGA